MHFKHPGSEITFKGFADVENSLLMLLLYRVSDQLAAQKLRSR